MSIIRFALLLVMATALSACSKSDKSNDAQLGTKKAEAAADNTIQNRGDSRDSSVTSADQGEGELDIKVTQSIRQALMADESFSTNAHNVKIVTRNGQVTLRGPVDSQGEKDRIQSISEGIAGANRVDNQIEIAPK